jgi:hypothetical protein
VPRGGGGEVERRRRGGARLGLEGEDRAEVEDREWRRLESEREEEDKGRGPLRDEEGWW